MVKLGRTVATASVPDRCDPKPSPEASAQGRQELQNALRVIQELPEQQREALLLVLDGGLSYQEIGRILGCSLPAVKVRIHRTDSKEFHETQEAVCAKHQKCHGRATRCSGGSKVSNISHPRRKALSHSQQFWCRSSSSILRLCALLISENALLSKQFLPSNYNAKVNTPTLLKKELSDLHFGIAAWTKVGCIVIALLWTAYPGIMPKEIRRSGTTNDLGCRWAVRSRCFYVAHRAT